jgi:hypothetical protein
MNGRNGFAPVTASRRWLGDKVMSGLDVCKRNSIYLDMFWYPY